MDAVSSILRRVPLFRHCTEEEIDRLKQAGAVSAVGKGHAFDLKKIGTMAVVLSGLFEIEAPGKSDILYLSPGSFFGTVPFTDLRPGGTVRALVDSSLMIFGAEELYRFFFLSFRSLRGYLRTIEKMGFPLSEDGSAGVRDTRVMTVCGPAGPSGKSFLAALVGSALAKKGPSIVLDLSVSENSVFDRLGVKLTPPLSHRPAVDEEAAGGVPERIERAAEGLDVLNVTFGSKVAVDPGLLQPLLFLLSKKYRYVIMDCSGWSDAVRDRVLSLSDRVFVVLGDRRDEASMHGVLDTCLREGQRAYYVLNEFFAGEVREYSGGLILKKFPGGGDDAAAFMARLTSEGAVGDIASLITGRRRAFVLEARYSDAIVLGGFFEALRASGARFDTLYSSSTGTVAAALHLVSADGDAFRSRMEKLFSPGRFSRMLDVVFPDGHVFKAGPAARFAEEAARRARLESFNVQLMALLAPTGGDRRIFSTGNVKDILAASLLVPPLFEERDIAGARYGSGYPRVRARCEDLIRTDIDEIVSVAAVPRGPGGFRDTDMLGFFRRFLADAEADYRLEASGLADRYILIDPPDRDVAPGTLMEEAGKISAKLLKDLEK